MDVLLICNKCFTPMYRGQRPFNITQCSHVFCVNCIKQVEKQYCFQCKCNNPAYLPLEDELLMPKNISLFTPFSEILEILLNMEITRNNQIKITMQRFLSLDSKYDMLKKHYLIGRRNMKALLEKYTIAKTEKGKLHEQQKQLMQMQNTPQSAPMSSGPTHSLITNSRYSSESLRHLKFSDLNLSNMTLNNNNNNKPIRFVDYQKKQRKVDDTRSSKSIKFFFTPSTHSNYNIL